MGWSRSDLIENIRLLNTWFRVVRVPTLDELERLEAGREKHFPGWFKYARLAVEYEQLSNEAARIAWAEQRSPWQSDQPHDALDCCWPLVTRQEFMLLEQLDRMPEEQRRAAFQLAAAWNSPCADRNKVFEKARTALAERMDKRGTDLDFDQAGSPKQELAALLRALDDEGMAVAEAYVMCDQAGRDAIARVAFVQASRLAQQTRQ